MDNIHELVVVVVLGLIQGLTEFFRLVVLKGNL